MRSKNVSRLFAVALWLVASTAGAAIITFQFSGTVTNGSPMGVLPGTPITGTFSYDTNTAPSINYKGFASYSLPGSTISATVGGHNISTGTLDVSVWNHFKGNVEDMVDISGAAAVLDGTAFPNGAFGFRLASAARNNRVLNSTSLPSSYNVSEFDSTSINGGYLQMDGGQQGTLLEFTVDSIVIVQSTP